MRRLSGNFWRVWRLGTLGLCGASKRFKVTYQTCILQHTLSAGSASCGFSTTAVLSTDWNEGCCVSVREEGQAKVPPSRDAEDVLKTMHCWMM